MSAKMLATARFLPGRRFIMKRIIFLAPLLLGSVAIAKQGMQLPPPPPELNKVAIFAGKWSGNLKVYGMGPNPVACKATLLGKKTLDNRYYQTNHTMDMGKMGKMEGMHLISYDPFKKQYKAFWFDSSVPSVMEMSGNFQGTSLIMISKPTEVPGMPAPMIMRTTFTKKGNNQYDFKLESKDGDKWSPMIVGGYRKVG